MLKSLATVRLAHHLSRRIATPLPRLPAPSPLISSLPARPFTMSAPDANLHKDEVTGEMVSKS